jgi:hypothetical protein
MRHLEARNILGYLTGNDFEEQTTGSDALEIDTSKSSPNMDYAAHLQTYKDFLRFMKYGVIVVAVFLV